MSKVQFDLGTVSQSTGECCELFAIVGQFELEQRYLRANRAAELEHTRFV